VLEFINIFSLSNIDVHNYFAFFLKEQLNAGFIEFQG